MLWSNSATGFRPETYSVIPSWSEPELTTRCLTCYLSRAAPYPEAMSQTLTLTASTPAGAVLDVTRYSATYRLTGRATGGQVFLFDLSPAYRLQFATLIRVAAAGGEGSVMVKPWQSAITSTRGTLTVTAPQPGEIPPQVSWTLGQEATRELQIWINSDGHSIEG